MIRRYDGDGYADFLPLAEMTFRVERGNQPPVARPNGPYFFGDGRINRLTAEGSVDPDADAEVGCNDRIVEYAWSFDGGSTFPIVTDQETLTVTPEVVYFDPMYPRPARARRCARKCGYCGRSRATRKTIRACLPSPARAGLDEWW